MHCFLPLALTHPLPMGGHRHLPQFREPVPTPSPFHNGVSANVTNRAGSLAAVGEYRRAMKALSLLNRAYTEVA
jgi:hypothetical protein